MTLVTVGCDSSAADGDEGSVSGAASKGDDLDEGASEGGNPDDLHPADGWDFEHTDKIKLRLDQAPSSTFSMCSTPEEPLNLTNAAWLAFMAINSYADIDAFAPALLNLGFGNDADAFWPVCARDLQSLQELERLPADDPRAIPQVITRTYLDDAWGTCARDWYEEAFAESLEKSLPHSDGLAALFERYLIQQADSDSFLQFFSGGEFVADGSNVTFKEGSTQVVWARHRDQPVVIVAFRGTEPGDLADIVVDLNFLREDLEDKSEWGPGWGKAHQGFYTAYTETVSSLLREKLDDIVGTDVEIWVTGHSLGGALATMFSSEILQRIENGEHFNLRGVVTFGSPRPGNSDFRDKYDALTEKHGVAAIRFRNANDVVTRVPTIPYHHVGLLSYFSDTGLLDFNPKELLEPFFGTGRDHSGFKYYDKLMKARESEAGGKYDSCR